MRLEHIAGVSALALCAAACGKAGPPVPPEPRGPFPPTQVAARQIGEQASVCFTVPDPRGSRPNQKLARAEFLRVTYAPGLQVPRDPQAFRVRSQEIGVVDGQQLVPGARACVDDETLPALEGGPEGWTLRYAVRVRDQHGRPSSLVAAPDLPGVRPVPPPRITRAEMTGDGVLLQWEPPEGRSGGRYLVYRAEDDQPIPEAPRNVTPLERPEFLDESVTTGNSYRYVVREQAASGSPYRESESSGAVVVRATDRFPPARPTGLVAVQEGEAVRLFWNPNGERDLAAYRVERRPRGGDWTQLAVVPEPIYLDGTVAAGDVWEYRILALDRAVPPNESEPSDSVRVEVAIDPGSGTNGGVR